VANRPLLDYLLTSVTEVGFTEIFITFGHEGNQIQQHLANTKFAKGIRPVFAPKWAQGPLASFQAVLPQLNPKTPTVLIPGDLYISPAHLRLLLTASAEVALLFDSKAQRPGTLVQVNSTHQLSKLTQSLSYVQGFHTGLPALRATPEFYQHTLTTCKGEPTTVFELLQCWLAQGKSIQGIPITGGDWFDVDTAADLLALNYHLLTQGWPPKPVSPGLYLPPDSSMKGPKESTTLVMGQGSRLEGPLLLGASVQIGAHSVIRDGSSLGDHTIIQSNTELTRCITLPHTQVPPNAEVTSAVLDPKGNALH
jgi:NDP-sugar pyrophosphorylase family protein